MENKTQNTDNLLKEINNDSLSGIKPDKALHYMKQLVLGLD